MQRYWKMVKVVSVLYRLPITTPRTYYFGALQYTSTFVNQEVVPVPRDLSALTKQLMINAIIICDTGAILK